LTTAPIQEGQALIGIPIGQTLTVSTPNPYGTFDYWTEGAGSTCNLQIMTPTTGSTWSFACTNPNSVLNIEAVYSDPQSTTCAANAVCANAYSQLGVPYVNGDETPYVGFDCSGLVKWAAFAAGLSLPGDDTVTQWDGLSAGGAIIPQSSTLPGDLVYFNEPGQSNPAHVGICDNVGCSLMIDAPHTGGVVRIESVAWFAAVEGYARIPGNN
jgi:cell wall-associated NlpC family hydrolase